jgi:hypothetical protein
MRADSTDGADGSRTGVLAAVELAFPIVVICTADPSNLYQHCLTEARCDDIPEKPRNLTIIKKAGRICPTGLRSTRNALFVAVQR